MQCKEQRDVLMSKLRSLFDTRLLVLGGVDRCAKS
jgi:hypothetical protein